MTDLVDRLRAANTWLNEGCCCGQLDASGTCMAPACIFGEALKMANEAAARIEKLEAALRDVMDDLTLIGKNHWLPVGLLDDVIYVNARAALEERT